MGSRVRAEDGAEGRSDGEAPDALADLRLKLRSAEDALQSRDEALRGKQVDIDRLERLTEELRVRLEQTEGALRERSTELQRLGGEFDVRSDALRAEVERWREAARQVADEVGAKAKARLEEAQRRLDQLAAANSAAQEELQRLEQKRLLVLDELSRNREELRRAHKDFELLIRERDARIIELEALAGRLGEERAAAKARSRELKGERDSLRADLASEQSAREAETRRVERLQAELRQALEARDRLLNSPSWKLTQPLRRVLALGRRLTGAGGAKP